MMAELQAKLAKKKLDSMTPEEKAAQEEKSKPPVQTGDVQAKLAMLNQLGEAPTQQQNVPNTKIIVNKAAPPPPPPPPPPKGLPPPPPPKAPANKTTTQPAASKPVVQTNPVPPPIQQQPQAPIQVSQPTYTPPPPPVVQPVYTPPPQPPAPVSQPTYNPPVPQNQQQSDVTYFPIPGGQKSQNQEQSFPMPKNVQKQQMNDAKAVEFPDLKQDKKHNTEINWFLAIAQTNIKQQLSALKFENYEKILQLQSPQQNVNENPEFVSIKKGLRQLDKEPNLAVIYFQKSDSQSVKVTKAFEKFLRNDNNVWTYNQNKQHLSLLKEKYSEQISNYKQNQAQFNAAQIIQQLDETRYKNAFTKLENIIKTKFQNSDYVAAGELTKQIQALTELKKNYDSKPPAGRQQEVIELEKLIGRIDAMVI